MPDGVFEGPIAGSHLSPFVPADTTKPILAMAPLTSRLADKEEITLAHVPANTMEATPNPFADKITISFTAAEDGDLVLDILSPQGGLVKSLHNGKASAGTAYQYTFNGEKYASGIYMCRFTLNGKTAYKRIALIK